MSSGHGGQILLSDVSAALVRNGPNPIGLTDLGVHHLRDLVEPERLWQIDHPDLPAAFPDTSAGGPVNLPAQRSSLVGRDLDVGRVVRTLDDAPLVTLTGVGGVGKTRLAVRCAAELAPAVRRVWFVDLAGLTDPQDVADTIAVTVGAPVVSDAPAALAAVLAGERTLLVLDNCEHVLDADGHDRRRVAVGVPSTVDHRHQPRGARGRRRARRAGPSARPAHRRGAVPAAGDGGRRRPAGHAARRCSTTSAAGSTASPSPSSSSRRAPRRSACRRCAPPSTAVACCSTSAVPAATPARRRCARDRVVVPPALPRRAAAVPASGRVPRRHRARRRAAHRGDDRHRPAAAATDLLASLVHKSLLTPDVHEHGVRYRMLETVRAFALDVLDGAGERESRGRRPRRVGGDDHRSALRRPVQRAGRAPLDPPRARGRQLARCRAVRRRARPRRPRRPAVRATGRLLPARPPRPRRRGAPAARPRRGRRPAARGRCCAPSSCRRRARRTRPSCSRGPTRSRRSTSASRPGSAA